MLAFGLKFDKVLTEGELMKYAIIKGITIEALISLVNEHIGYGWEPLGGAMIEVYPNHPPTFYQTMTNQSMSNDD